MVLHGHPKTPKNTSFFGVTQPPGVAQPYILGDTTRPRHVTCVLVWSKSDRRRLRKTLHKQTDKQTDTTKIMVTWPWTKNAQFTNLTINEFHQVMSSAVGWWSRTVKPVSHSFTGQSQCSEFSSALWHCWLHFAWGVAEAKRILVTAICVSVCSSPHSHTTARNRM